MPKHASLIAAAIVAALAAPAVAQQPSPPAFEKKEFTHSAWTKGIFSEAVTVKGAGRMIRPASQAEDDTVGEAVVEETDVPPSLRNTARFAREAEHGAENSRRPVD